MLFGVVMPVLFVKLFVNGDGRVLVTSRIWRTVNLMATNTETAFYRAVVVPVQTYQ